MFRRTVSSEWDFRESNTKEFTHVYHNYPAMMIPQIARKLLNEYRPNKEFSLVFDPYMGSGTTLVESMILGVNSIGTDINPLARIIAETKIKHYNIDLVKKEFDLIKLSIQGYKPSSNNLDFSHITNVEFWYSQENLSKLDFLHKLIKVINVEVQNFFTLPLSECVREASYTRNGEFKRYRIAEEKIKDFNVNPLDLYIKKTERNIKGLIEYNSIKNNATANVCGFNTVDEIPQSIIADNSVDMVVTSPPYGDSRTTVAYGQFSRWSNEWFMKNDTKNLDKLLMGGMQHKNFTFKTDSIKDELKLIKTADKKRYYEVLTFLEDYYKSIVNVGKKIRNGGRVCYVVGNRNVKSIQIPLDYFTIEMLCQNGFRHIDTFVREIPNKRMPNKTSPTNKRGLNVSTMMNEFIIILEKI